MNYDEIDIDDIQEAWEKAKPVETKSKPAKKKSPPQTQIVAFPRPEPEVAPAGNYSEEAEKAFLCCCFLQPDLIRKALISGVRAKTFYAAKNQLIWEAVASCYESGAIHIDEIVVAEKLAEIGQLQQAGGYPYIVEVSTKVDTPSGFGQYLQRLKNLSIQRYATRMNTVIAEQIASGELTDAEEIQKQYAEIAEYIQRQVSKSGAIPEAKSLADFERPANNDETCLLGKNRYACRGGGFVLSGPSGVGKTSTIIQMASQFTLGRDFMGITSTGKHRILIIQAEDDDGDIGEIKDSVFRSMNYTEEECEGIRERVFIIRLKTHVGDRFIQVLPEIIRKYQPDIVVLNPLLSYLGGDVSKQEVTSKFLREGLNSVNAEDKFMWILVHHTNKPSGDKNQAKKNSNEYMYNMTGSSDIVNWARGIITLESTAAEGVFVLRLAKRGMRAGVRVNKSDNPAFPQWETVTKIYMKHSKQSIELEGEMVPMIKWEKATEDDVPKDDEEKSAGRPGSINLEDVLRAIPKDEKQARTAANIKKAHQELCGADKPMSTRTWERKRDELVKQGLIKQREDGKFFRL
jgi:RecA-family ATPase